MNIKILIIILLTFGSNCNSQESEDSILVSGYSSLNHLKPANNYGQIFNVQHLINSSYYSKNEELILQFISYPSFKKISVISIFYDFKNISFRVVYTFSTKKDLYKSKERNVKTFHKVISQESVELIQSIYEQLLINTHYPKENKTFLGLDGTTYQFFVNGNKYGKMFGETWSPDEGTNTYYIVKVSKAIIEFTIDNIDESQLIKTIKKFDNLILVQ